MRFCGSAVIARASCSTEKRKTSASARSRRDSGSCTSPTRSSATCRIRGGRSATRYVRFVIRNDCLYSLYNEPWPLVAVSLPIRLWRYRRMAGRDAEPGGLRWILGELRRSLPDVRRERRAVSWATIREWRRLARTATPYRLVAEDRRQEAEDRVSTDATRDKSHSAS